MIRWFRVPEVVPFLQRRLALAVSFVALLGSIPPGAESPGSQGWQAQPAAVTQVSSLAEKPAPEGQAVLSKPSEQTFRDLVERPPVGGRHSVLPRETLSTSTLDWRQTLARSAQGSPYENVRLPELIGVALSHNLSLQNSERDVMKAKSSYRSAKASFAPFVDLAASALYSNDRSETESPVRTVRTVETFTEKGSVDVSQLLPTGGQITASGDLTKRETVTETTGLEDLKTEDYTGTTDVNITQPLLRGGGFDVGLSKVRQGRLSEMRQELSDFVNRREVASKVIGQFFDIAITLSNIEVRLASLDVRQRLVTETQFLVELGMKIPSEIAKAKVTLLGEEAKAVQLKQNFENQKETLLDLIGLPLTTPISFQEITGNVLDAQLAGIPDRETAIHEALADRPEMRLQDIAVRSAEIDLEVARNDTWPNLDLTGTYNAEEVGPHAGDALDFGPNRTWTGGLAFSIPLQNIQRQETRRRAELDLESAVNDRTDTERSVVVEVDALLRQMSTTEETLQLLRETVDQARFTLEQETELLKWGDRTVNQVQEAQDNFFNAEASYNQEIMDYQTLIAEIYRAIGRQLY